MIPRELLLCDFMPPVDEPIESWSPFALKTYRALNLAGLPYTTRHEANLEAYAELNPALQVPILVADGQPITDSTHIAEALARWVERPALATTRLDRRTLAEARLYEELADTVLNGFELAARWADPENWPRSRGAFLCGAPDVITEPLRAQVMQQLHARDVIRSGEARCWQDFERLLDVLDDRAPAAGFWVADCPTIADCALFGQLRSLTTSLTPRQARSVARRERLMAWLKRVDEATAARPGT